MRKRDVKGDLINVSYVSNSLFFVLTGFELSNVMPLYKLLEAILTIFVINGHLM